jgi:hypothetical protein
MAGTRDRITHALTLRNNKGGRRSGRSLDQAAVSVRNPGAGAYLRGLSHHDSLGHFKVSWSSPVHHLDQVDVPVYMAIRPQNVIAEGPDLPAKPPRGAKVGGGSEGVRDRVTGWHDTILTRRTTG